MAGQTGLTPLSGGEASGNVLIPITVTVTSEPKPGAGEGGRISPTPTPTITPTISTTPGITVTPSITPSVGVTRTPTPTPSVTKSATPTPTPSKVLGIVSSSQAEARQLFNDKFRVIIGFDGQIQTDQNGPGEFRRAAGWGADRSTFTWKRFLTLEDNSYNPYAPNLSPWSLKAWYKWGCRKFHFHNPFGKVAIGRTQQLVYEIDQFLNARDGLTYNGQVQNTPCPWMVADFVPVIRALTTGTRGTLDQATWDAWTSGPDAWFNPAEPIDLIVYVGGMADPGIALDANSGSIEGYSAYIDRWENLFATNPRAAARRLRESVQPLINAYCKIGFDASVASPGPVPGDNVALANMDRALQRGWWDFWKWLETRIGKDRMYVESHPFKKGTGRTNPYLGYNVIADDDWSTSKCCPVQPTGSQGPHATSEMGAVEFWRCLWQQTPTACPLIVSIKDGVRTLERYSFLESATQSVQTITSAYDPTVQERRLIPGTCCSPNHNYYWADLWASIIAFHLLEKQHSRGEVYPEQNITKQGIMVSSTILQILPEAYPNDPRWERQFGNRFPTATSFVNYLAGLIDIKKRSQDTVFNPNL